MVLVKHILPDKTHKYLKIFLHFNQTERIKESKSNYVVSEIHGLCRKQHKGKLVHLQTFTIIEEREDLAKQDTPVFCLHDFLRTSMMITWQMGVQTPENTKNFGTIRDWWQSLNTKSILWKQRLIPEKGKIDWKPQRFDETFTAETEVRGITYYWKKPDQTEASNITPAKLELDSAKQQLFLYPENQPDLVICVEGAGVAREKIKMTNPDWQSEQLRNSAGAVSGYRLLIIDDDTHKEIQIDLDRGNLTFLKHAIQALEAV